METGEKLASGRDHGHQGQPSGRRDSASNCHQLTVDLASNMAPPVPPADHPIGSFRPDGQSFAKLSSQIVAAKQGCPQNQSSSYTDQQAPSRDQEMCIDAFLDTVGSGMQIEDKQQSNGINSGKPSSSGTSNSQMQASCPDAGSGALEVFVRNEMGRRQSAVAGDSSSKLQQSSMVVYGGRKRSRRESLAGDKWMQEGSGIVERYAHGPASPGPECDMAAAAMELLRVAEQMNITLGRLQEHLTGYYKAQDKLRRKNMRLEQHNRTLAQENRRLSTELQRILLQSGCADLSLILQLASTHAELRASRQQVLDLNEQHKAELALIHDFYLSQAQLSDSHPDSS